MFCEIIYLYLELLGRRISTCISIYIYIGLISETFFVIVMEKTGTIKAKNKFLSFLPKAAKAAATLRFEFDHNTPFSPGNKDKHKHPMTHHHHQNQINSRGNYYNSGPITSVILQEARSKSKNSRFETKEPTSPKISCMGQIKIKHGKNKNKNKNKIGMEPNKKPAVVPSLPHRESRKKSSAAMLFMSGRKSDASSVEASGVLDPPDRAPSLSQMKRFASSRETLSKFDWTNPTTTQAKEKNHRRRYYYYSDEDRGNYSTDDEEEEEEEEEEEVRIPFSAPLTFGGGGGGGGAGPRAALEPRKEINLWKRRTMAQPKPLQLNN